MHKGIDEVKISDRTKETAVVIYVRNCHRVQSMNEQIIMLIHTKFNIAFTPAIYHCRNNFFKVLYA